MDDQFEEWWDKSEYDFMGFETSRGCARAAFKAGALAMRERAAKVPDIYAGMEHFWYAAKIRAIPIDG